MTQLKSALLPFAAALLLSSCALGPDYHQPATQVPAAYTGAQYLGSATWVAAAPADAIKRGAWWQLFDDAALNNLENQVQVSNQNVAAAQAAYDQARALVTQQRAQLFPAVDLNASATRGQASTNNTSANNPQLVNRYQVGIGGSWEPDVWGRLRRAASNASASAQASEADLASATLAAQGELASHYFALRAADKQAALLANTVAAYQRSLQIAQNRFNAGVTTSADVLQAQTQLANAQADLLGTQGQREQLQHAIAVLVGKTPEEFTLDASENWQATVPQVPLGLPSELLQRRPDIAAAERRVAAANAQIGVAKAGYFPSLNLTASSSNTANDRAHLFDAGVNIWSVGLSAAQTLFDAGATGARVSAAKAAHQQATARYRQTVLTAFADVENQLTAIRILSQQLVLRQQASTAADQVEQQALNRYREGQISYSDVVSSQASALSARRALSQAQADSQTAAVALIQALGGGWQNQF